jgi:hypothetical protein
LADLELCPADIASATIADHNDDDDELTYTVTELLRALSLDGVIFCKVDNDDSEKDDAQNPLAISDGKEQDDDWEVPATNTCRKFVLARGDDPTPVGRVFLNDWPTDCTLRIFPPEVRGLIFVFAIEYHFILSKFFLTNRFSSYGARITCK